MERSTIKYRRDIHLLFEEISEVVAVEVGVAEGSYSADILNWGVKKLYMVDLWESHPEFPGDAGNPQSWHNKNHNEAIERVAKFKDRYKIMRGPSTKMAEHIFEPLDLVYIDCCHSYECVKNDIAAYWPKLRSGGVMAWHDFLNPAYGVRQAVMEFVQAEGLELNLLPEDKPDDAGAWVRK